MPKVNVRFVMFIRLEDTKTLIYGSGGKASKYEKEAMKIKTKLLMSALKPDERKKINSPKHGKWLTLCDEKMILYSVCLAKKYEENLGNQFLDVSFRGLIHRNVCIRPGCAYPTLKK